MLTLWPSFSLLVFFLVIFLECRTLGGRVTLPLGSFLMVFCYGAIGAPLLALLFQQIPFFPNADADPASPIVWLVGPPVEELAKALPVIVLAFLTRESRRLSIADLTLIGFASGAGFGFVESNLNAIVNGTLPSVHYIAAFGLQTQADAIFFAGHPVSTALVGLAAGIGLRFLPPKSAYAWAPSALVILWACFDHGIYNWKLLLAANSALPEAHFVVEFLHLLTLNGQLQTWLLPTGLVIAQFLEARLCSKAMGARRDLMLAREWRPWVINEWLVALRRAPLGRAAFTQTLGYFRLRRAYYLATFEARRDPTDVTLSRHARSLEDRLKRERSMLFDPQRGTWLLPLPVLKAYAAQWVWRMRWVLIFAVLLLLLFMLDPAGLPDWLRQFLFGEIFAASVVVAGVAFAVWRILLFARLPPPDPLAAEGAACATYYTRGLLLGCAFVCGMFPTLSLLLGWKAIAPGAAFISGYLPGWIAQGGNLQALLGLGTIGAAVAPDPRPAGEALRHEIAAADDRMQRLGSQIAEKVGAPDDSALSGTPVQLDAFLESMAELDAERDAQARRQIALDECARQAAVSTIKDPAPTVQAAKDEFDQLAAELLQSAARELDAIAALEQTYGRAWIEIMQDLDAHDTLRRRLSAPLRAAWQSQNEIGWALRVVEATDECLLPMQLTLLPELDAFAATARSERAATVAEGVDRIRAAAEHYGAADPFDFAVGTNAADEDEAALVAELASEASTAEVPKSFGLRTPQVSEEPVVPAEVKSPQAPEPSETVPTTTQAQHYQEALDQLIDTTRRDQAYLDTIRHLELSEEPTEPAPATPETSTVRSRAAFETPQDPTAQADTLPTVASPPAQAVEVEDLIDAIKRDSGYLALAKEPPAQDESEQADSARKADHSAAPVQAADHAVDEREEHAAEPSTAAPEATDTVETFDVALAGDDVAAPVQEPILDEVRDTGPGDVAQELDTVEPPAAADDAPALEVVRASDSASDVVQIDAPSVADPVEPETVISQHLDTEAHTDVTEPAATRMRDVQAGEPHTVETAPQADEPAPEPAIEDVYLDDVAATPKVDEPAPLPSDVHAQSASPEPTDLLILDSPSAPDEPPASEPLREDAHAEAFEQQPTAETPEAPRASEEMPAGTEAHTSLFKRLLQSMHPQSDESGAQPRRTDQPALSNSHIPEQKELRLEHAPHETIAPAAAPWLSDLASTAEAVEAPKPDDVSLQPIEWPAPKPLAVEPVEAAIIDSAKPTEAESIDVAALQPQPESASEEVRPAETETTEVAADVADISVEAADHTPEVASDPAPSIGGADAEPRLSSATPAPDAMSSTPQQVDEFASKADRLSYLLAKLEGAIQAKAAAEAVARKVDAESAPREPDTSALPASSAEASDQAPRAVESIAEPETTAPDESVALIVAAAAVDSPARAAETPETAVEASTVVEPPISNDRPAEPAPGDLKPDRLSHLLTKLFETAKQQSPEPTAKPQGSGNSEPPMTPASAAIEEHRHETLDLSLPYADRADPDEAQEIELDTTSEQQVKPPPAAAASISAEAPTLPETPAVNAAPPIDTVSMPADEAANAERSEVPAASTPSGEPVDAPAAKPRRTEPGLLFGTSRPRRPRPVTPAPQAAQEEVKATPESSPTPAIELKPALPISARTSEASGNIPAATMPRRDWKLGAPRGDQPNGEDAEAANAAKKSEATIRLKTGSGALATVDAPLRGTPVAAEKTPAKYYGPKHALGEDDETRTASTAQQRALSLADALTEYYVKTSQPQPAMHTTDRATLQRIIISGKLEAPLRRGAPWSISGMLRRGEVAIRLKPGAEKFVEFVPSREIFGQVPHYYPRGVGKGDHATYVPAEYLEYFDLATHHWAPVQRG